MDPLPSRLYVRAEERVEISGQYVWRLEAVDADWQDDRGMTVWATPPEEARELAWPVSVLQVPAGPNGPLPGRTWPGRWLEVRLESSAADGGAELSRSIFGEPTPVTLTQANPMPRPLIFALLVALRTWARPSASIAALQGAFTLGNTPQAVGVHNVGQGNAVSVIENGEPALWIDVGGGSGSHTATWPAGMAGLCVAANPDVLLTHWDEDHWSAALRTPTLLSATWVAPVQALGPVTRAFAAMLSNLFLWPRVARPTLVVGWLEIVRPRPTVASKNNSGLIATVVGPAGQKILIPGDSKHWTVAPPSHALVASHHGGVTGTVALNYPVPATPANPASVVAYSYGVPNRYGHPRAAVRVSHAGAGWMPVSDRDTPAGNVHLYWTAADPDVVAPCGSACCATAQR